VCFCINFVYELLFFLIPRTDLSLKCAHQYYQIDSTFLILTSFSCSLHGAVVRALCALQHAPRLLQVAFCTHCSCIVSCCWVKWRVWLSWLLCVQCVCPACWIACTSRPSNSATSSDISLSSLSMYYTRLTALCPALPGWAGTRKVKPTAGPIYKISYNAKVTTDLRRTSNYQRFTKNTRLFLGTKYLQNHKIVRDSVRLLAYDIPTRNLSTL